ncbi:hypothetical protein GCM10009551_095880 [Nocardiopsis tropica]
MSGNDARAQDIKGFLTTRRARITPEDMGLPRGGRRRVPGLRREAVALLAEGDARRSGPRRHGADRAGRIRTSRTPPLR